MDFGKGLLAGILREGYESFLKHDFNINLLSVENKEVLKEIKKHYDLYKVTPSFEVIEETCQQIFRDSPVEPLSFWVTHCKKVFLFKQLKEYKTSLNDLIDNGDSDKFYLECKNIYESYQSLNQEVVDELLLSDERFLEYIQDTWDNTKTVQTPWPQLDGRLQGGYKPQELICFAARPGVGKTNLLLLSAMKAWRDKKKVLIIGTEMSVKAMQIRAMFFLGMYDNLGDLRKGRIPKHIVQSLAHMLRSAENREELKIVGGDFDLVVDSVEAKVSSFKPDVLFIDGVYLLKTEKNDKYADKHQRIAAVFDRLKILAKRYDIPIIVTTQLNRGNSKGKKEQKMDLDRLAFSDNVGMVTDATIFLFQDDEMRNNRKMGFEMGKLREGDCWDDVIVNWDFGNNNFSEVTQVENKIEWVSSFKGK